MAHVTMWPRGRFSETGTESNALRAGFGGVGRARSCMGSRLGPEMMSSNRKCRHDNRDEPEMRSWVSRSGIGAAETT